MTPDALRALAARCEAEPDAAIVLADWCEENARPLHATSLRKASAPERATAAAHLVCCLAPRDLTHEPALFHAAHAFFRELWASEWTWLAENLADLPEPPYSKGAYLLRSFAGDDTTRQLHAVDRCMPRELLFPVALSRAPAESPPLGDALRRPCPTCGAPALLVTADRCHMDAAGDPHWLTDVSVLCLHAPHVTLLAASSESYQPLS